MALQLEPLPYEENALEPYIGARTVALHFHKHHAGYLTKLKEAIEGTKWNDCGLEEIVRGAAEDDIFRNAAQTWNHTFFWKSMTPPGLGRAEPSEFLRDAIDNSFGSLEACRDAFAAAATGQFGSGWAWLTATADGAIEVMSTSDADNPMRQDRTPLLTLDVWEHAYYLDYQNERDRYVATFLDELINWRFAERNLQLCSQQHRGKA
jgi:Fe-Mn family superoxide dismutase